MNDSDMEFIEGIINTQKDNHKILTEIRTASRARIIWNVGIAGFALLNAKPYWEALADKPVTGANIALLSLPWVLSMLFGVIAYFLIDETMKKETMFFVTLFNAFDLFKIDMEEKRKIDVNKFRQINKGEDPSVNPAKKEMLKWGKWARRFELTTFLFLVLGFIWSAMALLFLC